MPETEGRPASSLSGKKIADNAFRVSAMTFTVMPETEGYPASSLSGKKIADNAFRVSAMTDISRHAGNRRSSGIFAQRQEDRG